MVFKIKMREFFNRSHGYESHISCVFILWWHYTHTMQPLGLELGTVAPESDALSPRPRSRPTYMQNYVI